MFVQIAKMKSHKQAYLLEIIMLIRLWKVWMFSRDIFLAFEVSLVLEKKMTDK